MLTFVAPSGLLALLGIAVPVAIHLWNRRPGRTVAVGSLRWLQAAANRRLRNLKLEQWALLLVRSALVAVLAGVLAGPVWRQPPPPRRGQVLISPEVLTSAALPALRPTIDSLRQRGFTLRQLGQGFPRLSDTVWRQPDSLAATLATHDLTANVWPRVQQAADSFPGQPLYVYTGAAVRYFRGSQPSLPATVHWQPVSLPDQPTTWLSQAGLASTDSLRLVVRSSSEEQTQTRLYTVARPHASPSLLPTVAGLPPLRYLATDSTATIAVLGADSLQVPVRVRPLRVWVYQGADHQLDARYLRAALRAASMGLASRLELTVSSELPPAAAPDWLFWLSSKPVPATWRSRTGQGLQLWQEAQGAGVPLGTSFSVPPFEQLYPVFRLDTTLRQGFEPVWRAANGRPVLSRHATGRGAVYQFHSRLHPAWSSLADSPELPVLLLNLLQPPTPAAPDAQDQRRLAAQQIVPTASAAAATSRPFSPADTDLRAWLVLAAALLWGLERLLARRLSAPTAVSA